MGLRHGDLKDTILSKVSIDEFEPKTGKSKDVVVIGFYVTDNNVGKDLYEFLNNNFEYIRDIEVSPNPNDDNFFMVFVEIDRDKHIKEHIHLIIDDLENVAGKLKWKGKTHLIDGYLPLDSEELWKYVIVDPDKYMTRKEFDEYQEQERIAKEAEEEKLAQEQQHMDNSNRILEFLKGSNLLRAGINNGKLHMQDARNVMTLEILDFGPAEEVMSNHGLKEAAIDTNFDRTVFTKLKSMLGEISVMPIGGAVVIYNPKDPEEVLITKTL